MGILDLLFPRRCVSCGMIGKYFCMKCVSRIELIEKQICPYCGRPAIDGLTHPGCRKIFGLDGFYSPFFFRGPVKKAIHLLKFDSVSDLVNPLTLLAYPQIPAWLPKFDCFVPVPLNKKRENERGFNQSQLIARKLGKKFLIPVADILVRKKYTKPQAELLLKDRKTNIMNVFDYIGKKKLQGEKIALVDDVSTTRLTLIECAKILKRNGAGFVYGLVIAHG